MFIFTMFGGFCDFIFFFIKLIVGVLFVFVVILKIILILKDFDLYKINMWTILILGLRIRFGVF